MRGVSIVVMLVLLGGLLSSSCSRDKKGSKEDSQQMGEHEIPAGWKFTLPTGNASEGRKIFVEMECYKCYEIKGETFPGIAKGEKGAGPELSQMAGMHPVEFFAESIINPNAVIDPGDQEKGYLREDGKSKMPDYNDVLTVKQVADLATYLVSLKGGKQTAH